jgi:formate-dependent nitrite reductase membrane component NrfD
MNLSDLGSDTQSTSYGGQSYYGLPAVKRSPWDWKVAMYLTAGALAGGAQLLAGIACRFGGARLSHAVRNARYIAPAGAAVGAGLLIRDLKTPRRFYNMLRIFRSTSPMSVGSYILTAFGGLSAITALRERLNDVPGAALAPQLPASIVAIGQCTYSAPLLAASSTPLWAAEPELLAARYATSAVALAAATLSLLEQRGGRRAAAETLDVVAVMATCANALIVREETRRLETAGVHAALREPQSRSPRRAAHALTIGVPLACAVLHALTRARTFSIAGSAAIVIGTALSKYCDIADGNRSADDPREYLRFTQPHTAAHV